MFLQNFLQNFLHLTSYIFLHLLTELLYFGKGAMALWGDRAKATFLAAYNSKRHEVRAWQRRSVAATSFEWR